MKPRTNGPLVALTAAALFGASTPISKLLLEGVAPWLLAGLLYAGAGIGMSAFIRRGAAKITRHEFAWLCGAVVSGGVIAPVLLMYGLVHTRASNTSLLLNAESAFTALLAWFVFREHFHARIVWGMAAIIAGAAILSWPQGAVAFDPMPTLAIVGACLAWAADNNLTRKVSLADGRKIAAIKGLTSGVVNISLALALGARWPSPSLTALALVTGWLCYGVSLALFVVALRLIGTSRTSAYFSVAPFIGAVLSMLLLRESPTMPLAIAGILMAIGVGLHLSEDHAHRHTHEALEHSHEHEHDAHHQHEHSPGEAGIAKHTHWHRHTPLTHTHQHFPDEHHRHQH
jgi:drug/metabolite transporter (DMT)-like permease